MKALLFERNIPRLAASRIGSSLFGADFLGSTQGAKVGPLRLVETEPPRLPDSVPNSPSDSLPDSDWYRIRPRLSGICGSDLAALAGKSSRWFEPLVSFPFVPGHEVVGELINPPAGKSRVVIKAVLGCATRGINPPCDSCQKGYINQCERVAFGHIKPGMMVGYCADTSGGWSEELIAHKTQLHYIKDDVTDEAAVMIEPTACALHAVESANINDGDKVLILGSGTLGLCVLASLQYLRFSGGINPEIIAVAKYPEQYQLAQELGAQYIISPSETGRVVRKRTASLMAGTHLTTGVDIVIDCVGSRDSLRNALDVVSPKGKIVLVGMPGETRIDMAPLWYKEITLQGAYTYSPTTFDTATKVVVTNHLERLVSAKYRLENFEDAIAHAAKAGQRGAIKVVFDMRKKPRNIQREQPS